MIKTMALILKTKGQEKRSKMAKGDTTIKLKDHEVREDKLPSINWARS